MLHSLSTKATCMGLNVAIFLISQNSGNFVFHSFIDFMTDFESDTFFLLIKPS